MRRLLQKRFPLPILGLCCLAGLSCQGEPPPAPPAPVPEAPLPPPPPDAQLQAAAAGQADGYALYRDTCSACHRADGRGDGLTPPLQPSLARPDADLARVIAQGIDREIPPDEKARMLRREIPYSTGEMPSFEATSSYFVHLTDAEMLAIVRYMRAAFTAEAPAAP